MSIDIFAGKNILHFSRKYQIRHIFCEIFPPGNVIFHENLQNFMSANIFTERIPFLYHIYNDNSELFNFLT